MKKGKNYFVVLENEGNDPPLYFESKNHAAHYCHQAGLRHFAEVNPKNPLMPVLCWFVEPGTDGQLFSLRSKPWKELVEEHDGTMH